MVFAYTTIKKVSVNDADGNSIWLLAFADNFHKTTKEQTLLNTNLIMQEV
jgi:hypothetical protein